MKKLLMKYQDPVPNDFEIIEGEPPGGLRKGRPQKYPELMGLKPNQSILYKWARFEHTDDPPHNIRQMTYTLRKKKGWEISSETRREGIWIHRKA